MKYVTITLVILSIATKKSINFMWFLPIACVTVQLIKRGKGEVRFHPIFPILFKTHQRLPKTPETPFFAATSSFFLHLCVIFLALLLSHSSKCHLHLISPFPCDGWCFVCCFLCNIYEMSYARTHDQNAWIGG